MNTAKIPLMTKVTSPLFVNFMDLLRSLLRRVRRYLNQKSLVLAREDLFVTREHLFMIETDYNYVGCMSDGLLSDLIELKARETALLKEICELVAKINGDKVG